MSRSGCLGAGTPREGAPWAGFGVWGPSGLAGLGTQLMTQRGGAGDSGPGWGPERHIFRRKVTRGQTPRSRPPPARGLGTQPGRVRAPPARASQCSAPRGGGGGYAQGSLYPGDTHPPRTGTRCPAPPAHVRPAPRRPLAACRSHAGCWWKPPSKGRGAAIQDLSLRAGFQLGSTMGLPRGAFPLGAFFRYESRIAFMRPVDLFG
jgi:hypothetical protein